MIHPMAKISVNDVESAKTKYDMCYVMDILSYKHLPWTVLVSSFSKSELVDIYQSFKLWYYAQI